jgi:predicted anti-sigma-YlaC factor YlaD
MKQHLSGDQVLEWVMGLHDARCEEHLRGCRECAEAIEQVAGPLRLFGAAARELGSEGPERVEMSRHTARMGARATGFWWAAALLAAALLIFAVLPRQREPVAMSDEALLQHVESELSESVPGPMEPLARLMTNETGRTR